MKILIVGSFRHRMYAPAFAYGFRQLGNEVVEIDYEQYHFKGGGFLIKIHNRIQDRFQVGLLLRQYNKHIIDVVNREIPDIVFLYRCYHIYNSTLKRIKGKTILMSYNNDDPFSGIPSRSFYKKHISNAFMCEINYVYRKKNRDDYFKIGVTNTKLLLPYYLSPDNKIIECEKDIPLAFLGHFENDGRDEYILKLKEAGIPVIVYGDEMWKMAPHYELIKDVVRPAKRGDEYNLVINRCKVCLVFFSKINHDTYTRRCFEIPITKTVMLSEYSHEMNELFPENDCAVYFHDSDELVAKAKFLLDKPSEIERIANNAYNRLDSIGGSETDRCLQIIEDWKSLPLIHEEREK